jgi:hypothetical protein
VPMSAMHACHALGGWLSLLPVGGLRHHPGAPNTAHERRWCAWLTGNGPGFPPEMALVCAATCHESASPPALPWVSVPRPVMAGCRMAIQVQHRCACGVAQEVPTLGIIGIIVMCQ